MTFTQFIIAVISVYAIYYLLMITFDLLKSSKGKGEEAPKLVPVAGDEVQFIEDQTTIIKDEETVKETDPVVQNGQGTDLQHTAISGGLEMKNLLSTIRTDAVLRTAKIFNTH